MGQPRRMLRLVSPTRKCTDSSRHRIRPPVRASQAVCVITRTTDPKALFCCLWIIPNSLRTGRLWCCGVKEQYAPNLPMGRMLWRGLEPSGKRCDCEAEFEKASNFPNKDSREALHDLLKEMGFSDDHLNSVELAAYRTGLVFMKRS